MLSQPVTSITSRTARATKHKTAPFRSFPPELRYSTYQKIMLVLVIPQSTSSIPMVLPSVSRYPPSKFQFFSSAKAIYSFVPVMLHQHSHYRDDTHTRKVTNANPQCVGSNSEAIHSKHASVLKFSGWLIFYQSCYTDDNL